VVSPALEPGKDYEYTVHGTNESTGCESGDSNAVTETTAACFSTTGPLQISGGQDISGPAVDLTSLVNANGATVTDYTVGGLLAPALSELESFDGGDPKGWAFWTTDNLNDPPDNRDLHTGTYTRSEHTGPSSAPNGSFLYYESSDGVDTVRTLTHTGSFNADVNELRVAFKYNMNGTHVGSMELQVRQDGGLWNPVWGKSGDQGDFWHTENVDLEVAGYISGTIDLRFVFTYGSGFLGDMALDEVHVYGPGRAGTTYFSGDATAAQSADTTTPNWPDATELRLDVMGSDNCGTTLADIGTFTFYVDNDAPVIDFFSLPNDAVSPISITTFMVSDNLGVTGYMITESATPPPADDAGWQATKPTRITNASTGAVTFYAWTKDAAGNVSASASATVNVSADVTAPTVTDFTMQDPDFSPVAVITFSASDDSGVVAGYMVTESSSPPASGDADWLSAPPVKVATVTGGATTFYAWARGSAGKVSAAASYPVTVKVDTYDPLVTFDLPATSDSLTFDVTTFGAIDNNPDLASNTGVNGYMVTESGVDADPTGSADPRWKSSPTLTILSGQTTGGPSVDLT